MIDEAAYNTFVKEQNMINKEMDAYFQAETSRHDGIYSPKVYFEEGRTRIALILQEVLPGSNWHPVEEVENNGVIAPNRRNPVANYCVPPLKEALDIRNGDGVPGVGYINISKMARNGNTSHRTNAGLIFKKVHNNPSEQNWIFRQLRCFKPDVLICFGTFAFFWNDMQYIYTSHDSFEYPHISDKVAKKEGIPIVEEIWQDHFSTDLAQFEKKDKNKAEKLFSCWVPSPNIKTESFGPDLIIQTYHPSYARRLGFKIDTLLPKAIGLLKSSTLIKRSL